jgi:NAD(P)-dependent dehydrogenase (short-subunit alcohol dehydrogenase family)
VFVTKKRKNIVGKTEYIEKLFGCTGRKAVVTGASSGLGAEISRALVYAGAQVIGVARRKMQLDRLRVELNDASGKFIPCVADLSSESGLNQVVVAATDLGGCDIVVANAGTAERQLLKNTAKSDFDQIIELNLTSQWQLAKSLFPMLSISKNGRFIQIASIYSLGASVIDGLGAYTISKHALLGLTRSLSVEWAQHGITVNAIAPGYFPTEMTESLLGHEKTSDQLLKFTPMKRFGDPSELAPAILFLASPKSSYVTGSVIPVDGGWSAW